MSIQLLLCRMLLKIKIMSKSFFWLIDKNQKGFKSIKLYRYHCAIVFEVLIALGYRCNIFETETQKGFLRDLKAEIEKFWGMMFLESLITCKLREKYQYQTNWRIMSKSLSAHSLFQQKICLEKFKYSLVLKLIGILN